MTNDKMEFKFNVFMDGDKHCATYPDFINLQESPAGFGDTPHEAIINLLTEKK
jgi:hypothetical protein